jgi:hypothetical protein
MLYPHLAGDALLEAHEHERQDSDGRRLVTAVFAVSIESAEVGGPRGTGSPAGRPHRNKGAQRAR